MKAEVFDITEVHIRKRNWNGQEFIREEVTIQDQDIIQRILKEPGDRKLKKQGRTQE